MRSLLTFLNLFWVWTNAAVGSEPAMPFMEYLDQNHLVSLKWGYDNPNGNITFKLAINTTGWVGFGFSPNGGMKGSDIIIGGVGPNGSYFTDRYAIGNSMPLVDEKQSYTLLSLSESDGQTIMTFQRSIQACDDKDFPITGKPIKLIYAYGIEDAITYHKALRGTKEVTLLNYRPRRTPTNLNYISARVDNVTIPKIRTYYHCKILKLEDLDMNATYYIHQVEPVIENPDLVHHMLLYRCPSFVMEAYDGACYNGDIGDACFGVVAAWAVGGEVFELPEDVGIPIGGEDSDTLYRLEIHYNNLENEAGRTDSSGLRLHYKVNPQKYDAAIMMTGLLPHSTLNYNIPPKATQFHSYGVCNTTLFSQLMNPVPELKVFAVMLHTHLAGRKVRVGQYKNGTQTGFLSYDENYNFGFQQTNNLGTIKIIQPDDEIAVECTYNTSDRTKVTRMGLGTTDEMCLAFLYYYPAIKLNTCVSHPNTSISEYATATGEDKIAAQESFLKALPQIQMASDDEYNFALNPNGMVREMMKTPSVTCEDSNDGNRLSTSWIMITAGILLPLWIGIM